MLKRHNLFFAAVLCFAASSAAVAQQAADPQFSARDIFESAKGLFGSAGSGPAAPATTAQNKPPVASKPAAPAGSGASTKQTPSKTTSASASKTPKKPAQTTPPPERPATKPANPPAALEVDNPDAGNSNRYGADVVKISSTGELQVTDHVLGLRYSIEKAVPGGWQEVSPKAEFSNGDTIRLVVETSEPAYLYIVNKGTSGSWNALFPSKENLDTNHRVDVGEVRTFPSRQGFTFYGEPGEEKLYVVASRLPQDDLEGLIYRLGDGGAQQPEEPQSSPTTLMASNFGDAFAARADEQMNLMRSRDLFVETIDEPIATGNDKQVAKAVYVVNVSGDDDSQVIAEVPLIHR